MKKLVFSIAATLALGLGLAAPGVAEAACSSWGSYVTRSYTSAYCSCSSASGSASYRPSTATAPGDGAGRINSGNNSLNEIQFYLLCHADSGTHQSYYYSVWHSGSYVYRACPSSLPHPIRVACRIRYD